MGRVAMVVAVAACILQLLGADVASSSRVYKYVPYAYAPYEYAYPPPPPPHRSHAHVHAPSPHVAVAKALVTGHVYCDTCKDGTLKQPLKGVTVGVICWNGKVEHSFYGITNKLGNFKVKLGGYDYRKHGAMTESCRVKLISPSYATSCVVPTNLHGGKQGAHLQIKSKSSHELILKAGPFAYTTAFKNKRCYHNERKTTSIHKHNSKSPHHHLHPKYEGPSCPAYKCKSSIPPSYKHGSLQLITNKHKQSPPSSYSAYKASPPNSYSFMYPPPLIYLRYKKKT